MKTAADRVLESGVDAQHPIAPDAFDLAAAVQACQRFVERSLAAG
ncbi:hypothetical protein [Nocardia sp. NPDC046763]